MTCAIFLASFSISRDSPFAGSDGALTLNASLLSVVRPEVPLIDMGYRVRPCKTHTALMLMSREGRLACPPHLALVILPKNGYLAKINHLGSAHFWFIGTTFAGCSN